VNEVREIRIIIVDDHPVVRGGIIKFLEKESDFKICGEAENAEGAIRLINEENPDIAIIDLSLSGATDGLELLKAVKSRFPEVRTLCLSMYEESVYAERAVRAGAKGYIQKSADPQNVIRAIRRIMDGKLFLSDDISDSIISKIMHGKGTAGASNPEDILSDRELDVYMLIGRGFGAKEIAARMNLSPNTIESHKKNIKDKLGLADAAELNKAAVEWVISSKRNV